MKKLFFCAFALSGYGLFIFSMIHLIGFLGNFGVAGTIDGPPVGPPGISLAADLGLIALFGLQHSLMARSWFKSRIIRFIPRPLERSVYVFASSLCLLLLMVAWQPLGGTIWRVRAEWLEVAIYALFFTGWTITFTASALINHWDLFGLRQVYLYCRRRPYTALDFSKPFLYKNVRHPLYMGYVIAFWATPHMTVSHLAFAAGCTMYILIGIRREEHNLIADFGDRYRRYRERTPMLFPVPGARRERRTGNREL